MSLKYSKTKNNGIPETKTKTWMDENPSSFATEKSPNRNQFKEFKAEMIFCFTINFDIHLPWLSLFWSVLRFARIADDVNGKFNLSSPFIMFG